MAKQYCSTCGTPALPTMRLCPSCGNKSFAPTPPAANLVGASKSVAPNPAGANSLQHGSQAGNSVLFAPASHGARLIAYVIDYVFVAFVAAILGGLAGAVGIGNPSTGGSASGAVLLLAGAAVPFVYFTIMHAKESGATFGKAIMNLKLVTLSGERLTHTQAFIRCLLTLIIPVAGWIIVGITAAGTLSSDIKEVQNVGAMAAGIGVLIISLGPYLAVFFNSQRQTLFDMICKTCVIKKA